MSDLCKKVYVDKEGKEYRALPEDPSSIVGRKFEFANGETRLVTPRDFPKNILHGAVLTGLGYVGSASLNNADGDVARAIELFDQRMARLAEGVWASRPAGGGMGGRDSLIVAAVLAAAETAGRDVDPDAIRDYFLAADIEGEGKDADALRSKARAERKAQWRKRADVEAAYQRIRAERVAEQAERAGAKGADGVAEGAPDFGDF